MPFPFLKTMLTKLLHRVENRNATFHCAPFSANSFTKLLRAFWCSGGCSPSACCFSLKLLQWCTAGHWNAIFHCAPFSANLLTKLVWACCCGGGCSPSVWCFSIKLLWACWCVGGGCSPSVCWFSTKLLLALAFARGLSWACVSCRATTSAEHLARSVLVAGLTELTVRFAPALQNPL